MLTSWWIAMPAGALCGVFSGLGIGGGSLLMVWMTAVVSMDQITAQGINLMYFIPTAAGAFLFHWKQRTIAWKAVLPAVIAGCICAALASFLANSIEIGLLKKLFGGFLLVVGVNEIRKKAEPRK